MKLHGRPVLLTVAAFAAVVLFLFLCTKLILLENYERLEEDYTVENVRRAVSVVDDDLAQLESLTDDYAGWDDAYEFVGDGNAEFIKGNLNDNIFPKLRLNFLAYVDVAGKQVFAKAYDLAGDTVVPVPAALIRKMTVSGPLLRHDTTESVLTGILMLPEGPLLISSRPVQTSEYKGPVNGTLIMGRFLDRAETERLAGISRLSLTFSRVDGPAAAADISAVRPLLSSASPLLVRQKDRTTISGFALLNDIYGQPAIIARIDMPRKIYRQGVKTSVYFIIWITGGCVIFALVGHLLYAKLAASRRESNKLAHMANHDSLTGLPNRALFLDRLKQALIKKEGSGNMLAVMFLDLDKFKQINDTLGHHVGDLLLKEVAERLRACVRNTDTVSRLGGDEFTLILDDIAKLEDSVLVAEKIFNAFAEPFILDKREVIVNTSIGIALYPSDGDSLEALLRNADIAMYHSKEMGCSNYLFFAEDMNTQKSERLSMQTGLRLVL